MPQTKTTNQLGPLKPNLCLDIYVLVLAIELSGKINVWDLICQDLKSAYIVFGNSYKQKGCS